MEDDIEQADEIEMEWIEHMEEMDCIQCVLDFLVKKGYVSVVEVPVEEQLTKVNEMAEGDEPRSVSSGRE